MIGTVQYLQALTITGDSRMDIEFDVPTSHIAKEKTLPPNTPSKPRAMRESAAGSSSTMSPPASRPRTAKELMKIWAGEDLPSPPRRGGNDHWSPSSRSPGSVRELFPEYVSKSPETILSAKSPRSASSSPEKQDTKAQEILSSRFSRSSSSSPEKRDAKAQDVPKMKYPSLMSVAIPVDAIVICYNCTAKGHSFTDCVVGCGRCGGNGHKTMECDYLGKGKMIKREGFVG